MLIVYDRTHLICFEIIVIKKVTHFSEDYMKKIISLLVLVCMVVSISFIAGCGEGQGITAAERERRHHRVLDTGVKQLRDDIDGPLLHWDEPNRASKMYIR